MQEEKGKIIASIFFLNRLIKKICVPELEVSLFTIRMALEAEV